MQHLKGHANYAAHYDLLHVFTEENLSVFKTFLSQHPNLIPGNLLGATSTLYIEITLVSLCSCYLRMPVDIVRACVCVCVIFSFQALRQSTCACVGWSMAWSSVRVVSWREFMQCHDSNLISTGLAQQELLTKMRLLSLASLASTHRTIPYSTIVDELQIELCDVENWVVQALSAGLIEARIDEVKSVVTVEYAIQSIFKWRMLLTFSVEIAPNVPSNLSSGSF